MLENDHMAYLYRYECKGIQDWILAGNKLRDVGAASELLDGLPEVLNKAVLSQQISSAAGAATLLFPSLVELSNFASTLPLRAAREAPELAVIHAWTPLTNDFASDLGRLHKGLAADRQRLFARLPEAGPLVEIASRTGQPAIAVKRDKPDLGMFLDAAGVAKDNQLRSSRLALCERLRKATGHDWHFATQDSHFVSDRIAVIHADGNGLGQWLMGQKWTDRDLKTFSLGLAEATALAFSKATQVAFGGKLGSSSSPLPLRPVVVGGDDVTIIIAGELAMVWIRAFLQAFEDETRAKLGAFTTSGFAACAGVVWCKPNWPYFQAYTLAESLCAEAKRELPKVDRGTYQAATSGLLFHRVTGSSETDWSTIRERELGQGRLSGGPWDLDQLKTLVALADVIGKRGIPRGTLRRWIDLVGAKKHPEAGALWNRFLLVGQSSKENKAFDELVGALVAAGVDDKTGMYADAAAGHRTPLFDALTLTRMTSTSDSMTETEANG